MIARCARGSTLLVLAAAFLVSWLAPGCQPIKAIDGMPTLVGAALQGNSGDITGLGSASDLHGIRPIVGQVFFPEEDRTVQATMKDVAKAATVSLINAASNQTLATALTDANGAFSLDVKSIPAVGIIFYLEGVKGLRDNSVGADAIRVRTFITYDFTREIWLSLTSAAAGEKLRLNLSTTAITIIASLRPDGASSVIPANLIGKLRVTDGNPPTEQFLDAGTNISQAELTQVRGMVGSSLVANADPYDSILFKSGQFLLRAHVAGAVDPVRITFLAPNVASAGDTVEIHGWGFTTPGSTVTFSPGLDAPIMAGATGVKLTVKIPKGAVSGDVTVQSGSASSSAVIGINQGISGGFNP